MQQQQLPTIEQLHAGSEISQTNDPIKTLVNAQPAAAWVKQNATANNSYYLSIDKVIYLMDTIFRVWHVEIKTAGSELNSYVVTVRVHYHNPLLNQWFWTDGIGAWPLQLDAQAQASDLSKIKKAAVQMAAPAAESQAIKDACQKIGRIFGRDLNVKDPVEFQPFEPEYAQVQPPVTRAANNIPSPNQANIRL